MAIDSASFRLLRSSKLRQDSLSFAHTYFAQSHMQVSSIHSLVGPRFEADKFSLREEEGRRFVELQPSPRPSLFTIALSKGFKSRRPSITGRFGWPFPSNRDGFGFTPLMIRKIAPFSVRVETTGIDRPTKERLPTHYLC
ncbi:hypothetical protein VNO77_03254 [Canavalia gladiata]|uniref:Uncharacterized protein n=1 Tax=Canavalia gladiata TaxID=3824 RepID=A0AAN9MZJ4_CANGL